MLSVHGSKTMPTIVVLDGYTLNPGDLSWNSLEALGMCTIHDRTAPQDTLERAAVAEIVLTNKTAMPGSVIAALRDLRYIGVLATGYNIVDVAAARERGILVTNVPAYSTDSVAQLVFAHLLNLLLGVERHACTVRAGKWSSSPDFSYREMPLVELAGLTMGIVGYGRIGKAVGRIARSFGMEVVACGRPGGAVPEDTDMRSVSMDEVFRSSDVVTLHCPLTEETTRLADSRRLSMMKRGAYLINTSRGQLVDERALADALHEGRIAGAGLDVLSKEPPSPANPLLTAPNCSITPHIGWATVAARRRLLDAAVENVRAFLRGTPTNLVF